MHTLYEGVTDVNGGAELKNGTAVKLLEIQ